ncbi:MAG: hypothetical protein IMZ66_05720 [Planctomycetes bacterium]|nr:hypothetical protein [Planctomycetota bacterium]
MNLPGRHLAAALALAVACAAARAEAPAAEADAGAQGKAFLVLGVTSDEDGLGEKVQQMLRAKARRLGAVVFDPSSVAESLGADQVSVATPPARLAALARDRFQADVIVTGHVAGREPYQVRVVAVRPGDAGNVFTQTYACANHHVIAVEMAGAVYDIFSLTRPKDPLRMLREDPEIDRRWREAPNLVKNPGFEQAAPGGNGPACWQAVEPQMAWVANPEGPGKVLKYDMNEDIAGGYGLDFYSDWIPIEPGATYRFSCRYRSLAPTAKIFLKGYHAFEAQDGYAAQRRETYRRQVHPSGPGGQWNSVTADFVPESTQPDQMPTFLKVDLYAYWPAGVIYWDDVVLKKVRDAPPAKADKKATVAPGGEGPKGSP